ncbi:MAG: hypothetical protein LBI42_05055 [Chitinispirillales bacterium]|jgi:endo-1,4-beta-D-glucanase Y|nr:hypothetical protein [Chitinispirillales bacterium]
MLAKTLKSASALIVIIAAAAYSQFLYPSSMPKVSASYDSVLSKTWQGIKKRNVDAYSTGMVHRPKSNFPDDAVSEGISYGMFLALYVNDQAYFNSIWNAGERYMWNAGGYYDWRRDSQGNNNPAMGAFNNGSASDADQDIALLLIFANELVKKGVWTPYTSMKGATYEQRARSILPAIREMMIARNKYLMPGMWGGEEPGTINPGYFAPAFYRVFAEFEPQYGAVWDALIAGSYELIARSPGYGRGLLPDWCTFEGGSTGGAGYNAYFDGDALYRDAIRVYWRLATDYLWYGEPRAKAFLDKAIAFLTDFGGPSKANFFDMNGNLLPADDTEILGEGKYNIERTRREHSPLTMGMWAAAAMGSGGPALAESYSGELLKFYQNGTDYWGYAVDPTSGKEDTLHNEMYFEQFLAWFGASILAGNFTNVWEDLKDGVPQGPPSWVRTPVFTPESRDIDASVEPLRISAAFNRSVRWTVTFTHDSTGRSVTLGAVSETIDLSWYGLSESGAYMPQGMYTVTISAGGLSHWPEKIWLGRPYANRPNLRDGSRLLIDDFAHGSFTPYIGREWTSFLDAHERPNVGLSTGQLSIDSTNKANKWLHWNYRLDENGLGFDPYGALEWNCGNLDLRGIDAIIFTARASGNIDLSAQLISSDFNPSEYQFFEDSVRLGPAQKTCTLFISNFRQRLGGSGKNLNTTLSTMTGIRFQVQYPKGSENTIMLESIYITGADSTLSKLYSFEPPPDYIAPTGPIRVVNRKAAQAQKFSVRKSGAFVHLTVPKSMAGGDARIINIKGAVVRGAKVPQNGKIQISAKGLAAGIYFVEVKKAGMGSLRAPLGNVR